MKSYGLILLYLFTWRTVITGAMFLGLLLLAVALSTSIYNPYLVFSLAVIAFMNLLGVPYLSAAPAMRKLIGNRSLSIMPNFSFRVGLVLLVLTIITAGFLPLPGWFFAMPGMASSFALKLFIVISLYTGLMQLLLPSQHPAMGLSLAPFLILFLLNLFEETVLRLYNNDRFIMMLSFATLGLWFYALWILAHKRSFKPAFIATFKNPDLNILFVLEAGMVLFAVLFRTLSKIRFNRVDWQVLKPVLNKRTQAES